MAVGNVVSNIESIAYDSYMKIQPPSGEEWVIHNIYHESDVELEFYDGANKIPFDYDGGAGIYAKYAFHVTNGRYLRIKNADSGGAKNLGYDGVKTKVA